MNGICQDQLHYAYNVHESGVKGHHGNPACAQDEQRILCMTGPKQHG